MIVVVIDVILAFFQEYQAQRIYVALKGLLEPTTTVIRDGQRSEVEIWVVSASLATNSMAYIFAYRSMRHLLWQMVPLRENKPLIGTVIAGLATVLIAFLIPGLRELLGIVPFEPDAVGFGGGHRLFAIS
jgi:hypothetical protein